jgi:hypothetical protein
VQSFRWRTAGAGLLKNAAQSVGRDGKRHNESGSDIMSKSLSGRASATIVGTVLLLVSVTASSVDLAQGELGASDILIGIGAANIRGEIRQRGNANDARLEQRGRKQSALLKQRGEMNMADAQQSGNNNYLHVTQDGIGNKATTKQTGSYGVILLGQHGDNNQANFEQRGAGNLILAKQIGDANVADISQRTFSAPVILRQTGHQMYTKIIQH